MRAFGFMGGASAGIDSLPNQIAIWDFSSVANVQTSSGNLDGATDLSGHGNNVTLSSNKPAYFSGGGQNNKGYISLSGAMEFVKTGITGLTTSPFTIYMVCKLPTPSVNDNTVALEYDTFPNGIIGRSLAKGYCDFPSTGAQYQQYNNAGAFYKSFRATDLYDESNFSMQRTGVFVLAYKVLKTGGYMAIEVNNEPFIPRNSVATATDLNITKFSTRCPSSNVYEIRILSGIPTVNNDFTMKNGLMTKYVISRPSRCTMGFGDSNVAGTQVGTTAKSFSQLFQESATISYHNFGVTAKAIYRTGEADAQDLNNFYANFNYSQFVGCNLLFMYGTNDSSLQYGTVAAWKAKYKSIIQAFIDTGFPLSKIVICTPPWSTGTYVGAQFINYITAIRQIASELGIVLADVALDMVNNGFDCNTVSGGDNIHMNGALHLRAYNLIDPLIV